MTRAKQIHQYVVESNDHIASSLQAQAKRIEAIEFHLADEEVQDALADEFGPTRVERIRSSWDDFAEAHQDPSKF